MIITLLIGPIEQKVENTYTRRWDSKSVIVQGPATLVTVQGFVHLGYSRKPLFAEKQMVVPCTNHHKGRGTVYDETFWILGLEHMTFGHTVPSQVASFKWVLKEE